MERRAPVVLSNVQSDFRTAHAATQVSARRWDLIQCPSCCTICRVPELFEAVCFCASFTNTIQGLAQRARITTSGDSPLHCRWRGLDNLRWPRSSAMTMHEYFRVIMQIVLVVLVSLCDRWRCCADEQKKHVEATRARRRGGHH